MLQFIRERAQGWLAGAIIALICIPFALWGIQSYLGAGGEVVVAEVNGEELGLMRFQQAFQDYRRQLQVLAGERFDIGSLDQSLLKNQALEALVEETLLQQLGRDAGLRIGDEQVRAAIRAFEAFQEDGGFSRELYERQLRVAGMSPAAFEQRMRRDMLLEQLRQGVGGSAFVTEEEARRIERLRRQRRDLRYLVIDSRALQERLAVTDEEIERHYEEHGERYTTPERVRLAYIELSLEALAAQVVVDEPALRAYYAEHREAYAVPEERRASHILAHVGRDADGEQVEAARRAVLAYRERALTGTPFEELIKQAEGSGEVRVEGGETGLVTRGTMPEEFDEALFAMDVGEISEPIRTDFGFHIVRLEEVRPGKQRSFDEARADVERDYRRNQAERLFYEYAERLSTLAFEHPETLQPAAEELGLEVHETGFVARDGTAEGIAAAPQVLEAAFSPEVLLEGLNSEPIELGEQRLVVVRVLAHEDEQRQPLADVRERIRDELVERRAREQALERGQALLAKLREGGDADALAAENGLEWRRAEDVGRRDPEVPRAVERQAFRLPAPEGGAPVYGGVPIGTGDYAIIELNGVDEVADEALEEEALVNARKELQRRRSLTEWRTFVTALKHDAEIRTYPGLL